MLNSISIVGNSLQITVSGDTPEQILENILKEIEAESINNLSVIQGEENLVNRGQDYTETPYTIRISTSLPSIPLIIDPDNIY